MNKVLTTVLAGLLYLDKNFPEWIDIFFSSDKSDYEKMKELRSKGPFQFFADELAGFSRRMIFPDRTLGFYYSDEAENSEVLKTWETVILIRTTNMYRLRFKARQEANVTSVHDTDFLRQYADSDVGTREINEAVLTKWIGPVGLHGIHILYHALGPDGFHDWLLAAELQYNSMELLNGAAAADDYFIQSKDGTHTEIAEVAMAEVS